MAHIPMEECLKLCWDCRHICQTTLYRHCLLIGGAHMEEPHVKAMTDCIQFCQLAADFMTRESAMSAQVCRLCADICESCASACEKIGDEAMMRCAEACRTCASACRDMGEARKAA
jgi:hypothetical protein